MSSTESITSSSSSASKSCACLRCLQQQMLRKRRLPFPLATVTKEVAVAACASEQDTTNTFSDLCQLRIVDSLTLLRSRSDVCEQTTVGALSLYQGNQSIQAEEEPVSPTKDVSRMARQLLDTVTNFDRQMQQMETNLAEMKLTIRDLISNTSTCSLVDSDSPRSCPEHSNKSSVVRYSSGDESHDGNEQDQLDEPTEKDVVSSPHLSWLYGTDEREWTSPFSESFTYEHYLRSAQCHTRSLTQCHTRTPGSISASQCSTSTSNSPGSVSHSSAFSSCSLARTITTESTDSSDSMPIASQCQANITSSPSAMTMPKSESPSSARCLTTQADQHSAHVLVQQWLRGAHQQMDECAHHIIHSFPGNITNAGHVTRDFHTRGTQTAEGDGKVRQLVSHFERVRLFAERYTQ